VEVDGQATGAPAARILVVDDDPEVRLLLRRTLERRGFVVQEASDGQQALDAEAAGAIDLIVLDLTLPAVDGLEVLRRVRIRGSLPVILLTGHGDEGDRVLGLEMGADDYVVKPFSPRELEARIRSVLRRTGGMDRATGILDFGELRIDVPAREVLLGRAPVPTTAREFDLLAFLASHPRQVFTREELLQEVWGSSGRWQDPGTVTEHVRRLRLKIESDIATPRWLHTVRRVGYRFEG
jgi:DNA-binding response OmpR family regulator